MADQQQNGSSPETAELSAELSSRPRKADAAGKMVLVAEEEDQKQERSEAKKKNNNKDRVKSVRFIEQEKSVRFMVPTDEGMQVRYPGGVLRSVKIKSIPVYPMSVVFDLIDAEHFDHFSGQRRGKLCRIIGWVAGTFATLALVLLLIMLFVYLHLRPRLPRIWIETFDIYGLWVDSLPQDAIVQQQTEEMGNYFAYTISLFATIIVYYENTNSEVDFFNELIECTVWFRGVSLGKSYIRDLLVPRNNLSELRFEVEGHPLVRLAHGYTLLKEATEGRLDIVNEFLVRAKMSTVGHLKSPVLARIRCAIHYENLTVATQICKNF